MKRIILTLVLVITFGLQGVYAQGVSKFIEEVRKIEGVQKMLIDSDMLKATGQGDIDGVAIDKLTGMEMIACSDEVPADIRRQVGEKFRALKKDSEYEELINAKDDGDLIRILCKKKNEIIEQILIMVFDSDNEMVIVAMNGNFTEADLNRIVNNNTKSN